MSESLTVRELYCPSHFGNSYEVVQEDEMRELLADARDWGFNRFSDWFDTIDLYDVYGAGHQHFNLPEAMWARKFENFTIAADLGLELGLVITPNHVFANQVTPENAAVKGDLVFGQLVCPSKAGGTELILANYRNLFQDFAARGLRLRAIAACPYDYGGCACDACRPWIVAFGRLFQAIAKLAGEFFGPVEANLIGWWWSDADHRDFTAWADREAPGAFHAMIHHLPYGETAYAARPVPCGCRERAFVHIGYGTQAGDGDCYGHYGPVIAPGRVAQTVRNLFAQKAEGFMAYSEGAFDDLNKALLGGLASGQFLTADEVLAAYARKHLGGDAAGWAAWLAEMGTFAVIDVVRARQGFDRLRRQEARLSWRLEQLECRLIMAEADAAVRGRTAWDAAALRAAETFWSAKQRLYRQVWRLGLPRHICALDRESPAWNKEYQELKGRRRASPEVTRRQQD